MSMKLEEYLESLGWLKTMKHFTTPLQDTTTENNTKEDGTEISSQTVGELFDMLKARKKSMPANLQINVPGWPGLNPSN